MDPDSKETINLPHLAATCDAVIMAKGKYLSDIAGWGGDLLTALKDAKRLVAAGRYETIYKAAYAVIGGIGESHFSYSDLLSDVDAYNIGMKIVNKGHAQRFSNVVRDYYSNDDWKSRYSDFYQNRFDSSPDKLYDVANYILNDVDPVIVPVRYMFFLAFDIPVYLPEEGRAVAEAWRDKFLVLAGRE